MFALIMVLVATTLAGEPVAEPVKLVRPQGFATATACRTFMKSDQGRVEMSGVTAVVAGALQAERMITITPACVKVTGAHK